MRFVHKVRAALNRISLESESLHFAFDGQLLNVLELNEQQQMDIAREPPSDLLSAMRHAQHRDLVARQYVNGFHEVFDCVVPWLHSGLAAGWSLTQAIIHAHIRLMAAHPDSLIARKCGASTAQQACIRAAHTLAAGEPGDEEYERACADFDFWLRSDGHRRNPGTTADLIAAGLFVGLLEKSLPRPWW